MQRRTLISRVFLKPNPEMHAPAIQGALTAIWRISKEAARIDRKYVVFPEIE